jgi:hypothetical protein
LAVVAIAAVLVVSFWTFALRVHGRIVAESSYAVRVIVLEPSVVIAITPFGTDAFALCHSRKVAAIPDIERSAVDTHVKIPGLYVRVLLTLDSDTRQGVFL